MKRLIVVVCLVLFSVSSFAEGGALVGWKLSGRVVDETNNPLVGASVALVHTFKGTYTDEKGLFEIKGLKAGKYTLKVSYMGYADYSVDVDVNGDVNQEIKLTPSSVMGEEIVVSAVRANSKTPMTTSNISKAKLREANAAVDLPLILGTMPSVVSTSESGGGIGNTAFRIRGVDPSRINVTLNGIPLNDAESQTVFWVDLPDLASSINSLQVQRGVGSSTNGAGAFGGTVSIQTHTATPEPYGNVDLSYGAFNTQKVSVATGSGLVHDKFSFDVRYSKLLSDGYVDHSGSNHTSMMLSGAWLTEKSVLRLNYIMGEEHTDISWNGVPSDSLKTNNRRINPSGLYYDSKGIQHRYDKEQDNYFQNHYQLIYSLQLAPKLMFNTAAHLTLGRGYYEEYKDDASYSSYGLPNQQVGGSSQEASDLIRQKWLNNRFYGATYSLTYKPGKVEVVLGGGANRYDGDHFGKIKWVEKNENIPDNYEWYFNNSIKDDFNSFVKVQVDATSCLSFYGDMQYRYIYYKMKGPDSDLPELWQTTRWDFLNPKAGVSFHDNGHNAYASIAVGNREPSRSGLIDAMKRGGVAKPKSEQLLDYELGYGYKHRVYSVNGTLFYMDYKDQLVNTGKVNDVGDPILSNVEKSYRLGLELDAQYSPLSWLAFSGNLSLSRNRIENFVEQVDSLDSNTWAIVSFSRKNLGETNISYSPRIVAGGYVMVQPFKCVRVFFMGKHVGKQYIDNTSSNDRKLSAYTVFDSRLEYCVGLGKSTINVAFMVNNVFDKMYIVNGYSSLVHFTDGSKKLYDGYFPQAGRNMAVRLTLNF